MSSPAPAGLALRVLRFAPVRILLAIVAIGAGANAVKAALTALYRALGLGPLHQSTFVYAVPVVIAIHLSYVAYVRLVERRRATELALRPAPAELVGGLGLGAGLFAATIGAIAAFGGYRVVDAHPWTAVLAPLAMALGSGYGEEVFFRGIVFRITEESLGTWAALAISALFFGLMHVGNPNATPLGAVAIALEAGVLLGAAYVFTRRLWLAVGIHMAWNFTQAGIFGVRVSGYRIGGLLESQTRGPAWLSGGGLGAEGSVFALVFCLAAGVVLLVLAHRRGRFVAPAWRRRAAAAAAPAPAPALVSAAA